MRALGLLEGNEVANGSLVTSQAYFLKPCWDHQCLLGTDGRPGVSVSMRQRTKGIGFFL